jgi:hypothetical protein
MYVKIVTSGPRRYVKLVEAFRDARGVPRQRVIATLGRLEAVQAGEVNPLIDGLLRASGQPTLAEGTGQVEFAPARSVGDTWLLTALWQELGFGTAFRHLLRRAHPSFDAERLLRVMVFNRLCDPESKLGILRWLEGALVPGVAPETVSHQRLLRTMDTLVEHGDELEAILAGLLRPLLDQELSIVFYDLTTLRLEGQSTVEGELRQYGMAKEGDIARQCLLGVVQTAEGLPIYHEVFAGNTAETTTLVPTIQRVLSRFPIRRVIVVADRGLLSLDNLAELQQIRIGEQSLEFILAVPGRRYVEFTERLQDFHTQQCAAAADEITGEVPWQGFRLVVAHHPEVAAERTAARDQQIATLEQQANVWAGKLDGQDTGTRYRGRKLSDGGVMARFHRAVSEAKLSRILRVDLTSPVFTYEIDESALALARMMDGKLLLVTNVQDLTPEEIVARYKALADIERGFRVLKSEIEIAPIFHRLPDRIRAHALICFLALILYRVLRMRLKARHRPYSPERALEITRRIQLHQVTLHQRHQASGLTHLTLEQQELFADLELPKPTSDALQANL